VRLQAGESAQEATAKLGCNFELWVKHGRNCLDYRAVDTAVSGDINPEIDARSSPEDNRLVSQLVLQALIENPSGQTVV